MYTNLHSLAQSLRVPSPGGKEVLKKVLYGEAPHGGSNTNPFNTEMVPLSYTYSYFSRISQNYIISYNCHVFLRLSVVLISDSKGASFYV